MAKQVVRELVDGVWRTIVEDESTGGGGTQDLESVLTQGADAGGLKISNAADGTAASDLATVGQLSGATGAVLRTVEYDSEDATLDDTVDLALVSTASGTSTITLPTAVGIEGRRFLITKTTAYSAVNACVIIPSGSETIGGYEVRMLAGVGESLEVISDGANWQIVGGNQEQFHTPKEWFVGGPVSTGATGRSPRGAFQKFSDAMAAAISGDTIYICDTYKDYWGGAVIDKSVSVVGLGNRPIFEIAEGDDPLDITSVVVKVTADNVQIDNLTIRGTSGFVGTCLLFDHAASASVRHVNIDGNAGTPTAYPTSAEADTGIGGAGIVCNSGEGSYFEDLHISGCSIGLGIGNECSTNKINRMTIVGCYQDIVSGLKTSLDVVTDPYLTYIDAPWDYGGGNGGGWTISHVKDTAPITRAVESLSQLPVIEILSSSGAHIFESFDVSEGQYQIVDVAGAENTFIRLVTAPNTLCRVTSDANHFINTRILGAGMLLDGDRNTFDGGQSNGTITGSGSRNRFRSVNFSSSTDLPLAMTGTDNSFDASCTFGAVTGSEVALDALGDRPKFPRAEAVVTLTYDTTITPDLRLGTHFVIDIDDAVAWTLEPPIDTGNTTESGNPMLVKEITFELRNSSGGVGGTITLDSVWQSAGLTAPPNGETTLVTFFFDGTNAVEQSRSRVTTTFADVLANDGDPDSNPITGAVAITMPTPGTTAPLTISSPSSPTFADLVTNLVPVSWWRMGEPSGNMVDEMGVASPVAVTGDITQAAAGLLIGDADTAYTFGGTGGYLDCGNHTEYQITEGTIVCLLKTADAGSGYRFLFGKENAYNMFLIDNVLGAYDYGNGAERTSGVSLNDNVVHLVALTFQTGAPNAQFYVDGSAAGSAVSLAVADQTYSVTIGVDHNGDRIAATLDEAMIFDYRLTADQIAALNDAATVEGILGGDFNVSSTGAIGASTAIAARVSDDASQTIEANGAEALTFGDEDFDNDTIYDGGATTRLTCNTAGVYLVTGTCRIAGTGVTAVQLYIRANGTTAKAQAGSEDANDTEFLNVTDLLQLADGDYLELIMHQETVADADAAATDRTFAMSRIA